MLKEVHAKLRNLEKCVNILKGMQGYSKKRFRDDLIPMGQLNGTCRWPWSVS